MRRHRVALAIAAPFLLLSCGAPQQGGTSGGVGSGRATAYDATWQLSQGRSAEGPIAISKTYPITLSIAGNNVGGTSACNDYSGSLHIEGNEISVGGLGGTEMACNSTVMEAEARYLSALESAEEIERTDDVLTIRGADSELVFRSVPPPPTADLTGVRWELQGLLHGGGSERTLSTAHPAHLHFGNDGTFEGSTGCRRISGEWKEAATGIAFTYFEARGHCSDEDLMEQNDTIINIGDGFTFEIQDRTLTIYGRFSEIGLLYRGASSD